jgi:malate dehydrogenase (oxaloacetate-decarboxylating)(NADP+)
MGQEVNSSATDLDQSAVEALNRSALEYHRVPRPGKIAVLPIKGMTNQRDLALAYSPGVAAPCMAIHADPSTAALYTSRSNLVAVVSNGTAVLGSAWMAMQGAATPGE